MFLHLSLYPSMQWAGGMYTPLGGPPPPQDSHWSGRYTSYWNAFLFKGAFTLPNTKREWETDRDTDKLTLNPMRICDDVCLCAVWTPPHNSIQPIFIGLGVGQCEHTITGFGLFKFFVASLCSQWTLSMISQCFYPNSVWILRDVIPQYFLVDDEHVFGIVPTLVSF